MTQNQRDARLSSRDRSQTEERALQDRAATEDRVMTDQERLDALRFQTFNKSLPDLPQIPGWHPIWLTTMNPRDSIQTRIRMGYEPITIEDVPHWENYSIKTGDYQGLFGVNEMLAFKLPDRLYKMYMKENHHDAPNREEEKLNATLLAIKEQAERSRARVDVEEGTAEMGRGPTQPIFEQVE